jgi:hypothetical protein
MSKKNPTVIVNIHPPQPPSRGPYWFNVAGLLLGALVALISIVTYLRNFHPDWF